MGNPKRKCTFSDEYEKIDGVKRSKRKGDGFFFCTYCNDDYNLESMGKTAITQHHEKTKHKDAVERMRKKFFGGRFALRRPSPEQLTDFMVVIFYFYEEQISSNFLVLLSNYDRLR